ncbi:flagellar hook-basal body complex protein, partial [Mesorhizobium sp. M1121]|uniref:flagellar hook-basal body complex protein n=1 Tax=Mesorhizobium sp. M1121 TaxID=2957058 RepID=UPI00333AF396
MQDSLYVALSSQIALERRLDTIADNVANASTIGFRATGVKFEDVVSGSGPKSVSFASSGKTYLSGAHGAMTQTGNPFDFAVQGDAWFGIDTPAGTVMTRDGRFSMNENGELMSLEGHPVLDAGGAPIQLDPRDGPPKAGGARPPPPGAHHLARLRRGQIVPRPHNLRSSHKCSRRPPG